jgi:hypothetical protein
MITTNLEFNNTLKKFSYPCIGETSFEFFISAKDLFSRIGGGSILELGFNRGASCLSLLEAGFDTVDTVDRRDLSSVKKSCDFLTDRFGKKFKYIECDHTKILNHTELFNSKYDLVFIDGDHSKEAVIRDIKTALTFKPKYILFDDYLHPYHSKDIKEIISNFSLDLCHVYDSDCGQALIKLSRDKAK